ncbi:hypothetical protein Tco_1400703 [Tanacetum coccineum]
MHEQFSQILSVIGKSKTPKPKAPTFAITTRSGVNTRDPPFPTPANHTEGATEKEGSEGVEPSIIHNKEPAHQPSIFYQPFKSSNMSFPSIVKKPKKDDEDERLLSIFKWIHINLSFLEAMIHMPNGAKESAPKRRRPRKLHTAMSYRTPGSKERLADLGEVSISLPHTSLSTIRISKLKTNQNEYVTTGDESYQIPHRGLRESIGKSNTAFLQETNQLQVLQSPPQIYTPEKAKLLKVLKNHKGAIAWSIMDIKGIDSSFYAQKILMEDEFKPSV